MNIGLYQGVPTPPIIRGRYDPIFARRDFGIRGDGQGDDSQQLQRFLDEASGRLAVIESGLTCTHTGQLYVRDASTIQAYGATIQAHVMGKQETTGLHFTDASWAGLGPTNCTLSGVTYRGNAIARRAAGSLTGVLQAAAIYCVGTLHLKLRDVRTFDTGGDGFYIGGNNSLNRISTNFNLENCYAEAAGRNGYSFVGAQYGALINCRSFNHSYGSTVSNISYGYDLEPDGANTLNGDVMFLGCNATYCTTTGFGVNTANGDSANCNWVSCYAEGNGVAFYASAAGSGVRVIGGRLNGNTTSFTNLTEKIASFP